MAEYNREISAQAAVIGCLLIDPTLCGEIFDRVKPEDFIDAEYRHVFEAARGLFFSGKPVDAVTVCHAAGDGVYRDFIMQILDITPTAASWQADIEVMLDCCRLHKLQDIGNNLISCTSVDEARQILADAQQLTAEKKTSAISIAQGLIDFHARQNKKAGYLQYGISVLDKYLRTSPGHFVVIGGRPSAGKTAFALQIANTLADKHRVGFFSLETGAGELYDRYIAQTCMIDFGAIKTRSIPEKDYTRLVQRQKELAKRQLEIIPAAGFSAADIQAATLSARYDVILIDYLQLLRETGRNSNRTEAVSRMSMELHRLAQAHGITVIALSQLGRPEGRESQKAPTLSSLRESGQIEQDADAVILLYLTDPSDPRSDRRIKIAKNKEGELGYADMDFEGRFQRFVDYMPQTKMPNYSRMKAPASAQQAISGMVTG